MTTDKNSTNSKIARVQVGALRLINDIAKHNRLEQCGTFEK